MEKTKADFIPYAGLGLSPSESVEASRAFRELMERRRSLRMFSEEPVPREVIEQAVMAASSAPSGAHKQPWTFCVVSRPEIKQKIRQAAEREEFENYNGRMSDSWLRDLQAFDTDWHKPFLETAPYLIVVFKQLYAEVDGKKQKHYYVNESVGLAVGFFLVALHQAGLVALTHTPSPMNFLQHILERPDNERPFLLIPVGYPPADAIVPDLQRKALEDVAVFYE